MRTDKLSSAAALAALASGVSATDWSAIDWSAIDYHGHYFRQEWVEPPVVVERLDPIMNPGQIATHVHSFLGANAVSATTNFNDTQDASCSQVYIKADKSLYWAPALYFQDPTNKTFTRVKEHHRVLYYFNRAADPDTGAVNPNLIEEFPEGFKMIAGDGDLRAPAATEQLQNSIEWFCHGPDVKSSGFPGNFTSCPNGFAGSVRFPYCWNGEEFNVDDPHAHMSYPKTDAAGKGAPDSGPCPDTHPHIMPTIFIEFWFDTKPFDGLYGMSDQPWVVSNGDPTGYGFHADFLSGWEKGVLGKQLKECNIGESGEPLENCFDTWEKDGQKDLRENCSQEKSVTEEVEGWLDALPGCNPLQYGPEKASMQTNCKDTASLGTYPSSAASSVVAATAAISAPNGNITLPSGWTATGCHSDAVSPRSLSGKELAYWGEVITSSGCAKYCDEQGFSIAGTEYGEQCFCGDDLTQSEVLDADKCDMKCKGDAGETCGGKGALNVFVKGAKSTKRSQHFRKHVGGGASARRGSF